MDLRLTFETHYISSITFALANLSFSLPGKCKQINIKLSRIYDFSVFMKLSIYSFIGHFQTIIMSPKVPAKRFPILTPLRKTSSVSIGFTVWVSF